MSDRIESVASLLIRRCAARSCHAITERRTRLTRCGLASSRFAVVFALTCVPRAQKKQRRAIDAAKRKIAKSEASLYACLDDERTKTCAARPGSKRRLRPSWHSEELFVTFGEEMAGYEEAGREARSTVLGSLTAIAVRR